MVEAVPHDARLLTPGILISLGHVLNAVRLRQARVLLNDDALRFQRLEGPVEPVAVFKPA